MSEEEKKHVVEQGGGYLLNRKIRSYVNSAVVALNLTHKDPAKRGLYQQKDFRIALSLAIDRLATHSAPGQCAPREGTAYYHEQLAAQHVEFSPEKAIALLDGLGLSARDARGYRLDAGGGPLLIRLATAPEHLRWAKLLKTYWAAAGVAVQIDVHEEAAIRALVWKNEHDAVLRSGRGGLTPELTPGNFFPFDRRSAFGIAWARWYADPDHPLAELPPEPARRQMALYDEIERTADAAHRSELLKQILDIAAEEFYLFGFGKPESVLSDYPARLLEMVSKDLGNVPRIMPGGYAYSSPAFTSPSQYYFKSSPGE